METLSHDEEFLRRSTPCVTAIFKEKTTKSGEKQAHQENFNHELV
jgi:hypothetical protein